MTQGEKLKQLRQMAGLSQWELGDSILGTASKPGHERRGGKAQKYICYIETGRRAMTHNEIVTFAKYFGTDEGMFTRLPVKEKKEIVGGGAGEPYKNPYIKQEEPKEPKEPMKKDSETEKIRQEVIRLQQENMNLERENEKMKSALARLMVKQIEDEA